MLLTSHQVWHINPFFQIFYELLWPLILQKIQISYQYLLRTEDSSEENQMLTYTLMHELMSTVKKIKKIEKSTLIKIRLEKLK